MDMGWKTIEPLEQLLLEEWKPNKPIVITITFTLARDVNIKFLQNTFIPRLISHPRFASIPVRGRNGLYHFEPAARFTATSPSLVDHHIQIEQSIPENEPEKEQLRLFTSRLNEIMSTPLSLDRPLWKLHLFNGWSLHAAEMRRNTSTLVLRVHHAVADGVGLVKYFLSQLVDSHPLDSPLRLLVPQARYKNKGTGKPTHWDPNRPSFLRSALEAVEDFHRVNLKPWAHPDPESVFTRDPLQENNLCAMLPPRIFTVDVLKKAAKRLGITVNDLLLAAWAGAVREYVKEQGEDPSIMKGMRCAMPYNKHHCMEFEMSDVSNRLALLSVALPISLEDRGVRVEKCADNMRRVKRSIQPSLMLQSIRNLMYMPSTVRRGLWNHVAMASCLFSNLAGPTERVRVGGVDVTAVYSFPPCNPHVAVNTGMLTYDGALFVSVSGDANRLAHPHKLVGYIYHELTAIISMSDGDGT